MTSRGQREAGVIVRGRAAEREPPKNPRLVEVAMSDFAPAVIAARWGVAAERKPPETVDQPLAACD